jgi:putative transcriptional regulator
MPKNVPRVVNYRFKELRKRIGTQDYVGNQVGVTGTTIRYIENGYMVPSGKLMLKLSKLFGVSVEELFGAHVNSK